MINLFGKFLVMIHVVLSLLGLSWAVIVFVQGRDLGFATPYMDVLEVSATDGRPTKAILHASAYDKSYAALTAAAATRDRTYFQVKPVIDSLQKTEPYLASNHLFYRAELKRLKHAKVPIEVKHFKEPSVITGATNATPIVITSADHRLKFGQKVRVSGITGNTNANGVFSVKIVDANSFSLEDSKGNGEYGKDGNLTGRWTPADDDLAIPEPDSAIVVSITKSKDLYEEDLKVALRKIDVVEGEIKAINTRTKEFTAQTTGTDELNKYVQPGLYQLYEQEFGAQREIKKEIEEIKPYWSQAIEKAFLLKDRRIDLEKQRDTLLKGLPPHLKDNKKK